MELRLVGEEVVAVAFEDGPILIVDDELLVNRDPPESAATRLSARPLPARLPFREGPGG
jgi:hypothetical protein